MSTIWGVATLRSRMDSYTALALSRVPRLRGGGEGRGGEGREGDDQRGLDWLKGWGKHAQDSGKGLGCLGTALQASHHGCPHTHLSSRST